MGEMVLPACAGILMEARMPAKPSELDNINRLRVEAEREVARLREVLLLIASSSPDKATRLEARRALAKDSRGAEVRDEC